MRPVLFASALLAALMAPAALSAAEDGPERVGPFVLVEEAPELLVLAGDITVQTPLDFKTALLRRPEAKMLVLSSAGGNVTGGLLLADEVHLRGLDTYVPAGTGCYSACAYVFLAGKSRLAEGELGVHQFSGPSGDMDTAQVTVANMLDIMHKFGVEQGVISRMLRTGADEIHVFSRKEISELGINRDPEVALAQTLPLRTLPEEAFGIVAREDAILASAGDRKETSPAPRREREAEEAVPAFAIYEGVDFYGNDVGKIRADDFGACFAACMDEKQCFAITFNTDPRFRRGPNCFLKEGSGRVEPYEHAISGLFLMSDEDMDLQVGRKTVSPVEVIK